MRLLKLSGVKSLLSDMTLSVNIVNGVGDLGFWCGISVV